MLRLCIWPGTCRSCNLQLLKVVFTADSVSIWCQQSLSLSLALMGSLMQLLQLLCAFHFTQGNCLSSVYNPHSYLCLFFFSSLSLFSHFFLWSLCCSVTRLANNWGVVNPDSLCVTGVCWAPTVAYHCPCHRSLLHSQCFISRSVNLYQHT